MFSPALQEARNFAVPSRLPGQLRPGFSLTTRGTSLEEAVCSWLGGLYTEAGVGGMGATGSRTAGKAGRALGTVPEQQWEPVLGPPGCCVVNLMAAVA